MDHKGTEREKERAGWPQRTNVTWKHLFIFFSALLVNIPHSNYFTNLQLCMTDACLYRAFSSSVLKHISVCLTKNSSCFTGAPDQSQADFSPEAYASIFVTYMSPLVYMPFHARELHHKSLQFGLWSEEKKKSQSVLLSILPSLDLFSVSATSQGFNHFY